jgi:hypothetical protein
MRRVSLNIPIDKFKKNLSERAIKSNKTFQVTKSRAEYFLNKKINSEFNYFISEVEQHPVSQEISEGAGAENSNFLNRGNLFSFIGFYADDSPIKNLVSLLRFQKSKIKFIRKNKNSMVFNISIPDKQFVYERTPMPWTEKSWVEGIESGISGFGMYLSKKSSKSSRSGGGIQSKNNVRKGKFKNTKYLSFMINNYVMELKKNIRNGLK